MENHLGENGDDCKKCITSIISGSKVFLEKLLLPKDRQFINNTCVKNLTLDENFTKRKGTQKHTYKIACVLTILIHAYVSSTIH